MEKSSYAMLVFMLATLAFFIIQGSGTSLSAMGWIQVIGFTLLGAITLIALASIPVLIYCYFVKKIPDIDYSINVAFAFVVIGIITELV